MKSVNGNFTVHPNVTDDVSSIINIDLVILGVKSWQVEGVAEQLKSVINKNTLVKQPSCPCLCHY